MRLPTLRHGAVALEPLADGHREALRAACAADREIWAIYSYSMLGDAFDAWWARAFDPDGQWRYWAVLNDGALVGVTGRSPQREAGFVELGGTYYHPAARGTGLNRVAKWLLLRHVFAAGERRVEFRVDARNARSRAAVLRIGAVQEGVLRRHKVTHTGFVRDTVVFAITDLDWATVEPALRPS